jgi:hypothetical protein
MVKDVLSSRAPVEKGIKAKLGMQSRLQALVFALRYGVVDIRVS